MISPHISKRPALDIRTAAPAHWPPTPLAFPVLIVLIAVMEPAQTRISWIVPQYDLLTVITMQLQRAI